MRIDSGGAPQRVNGTSYHWSPAEDLHVRELVAKYGATRSISNGTMSVNVWDQTAVYFNRMKVSDTATVTVAMCAVATFCVCVCVF